MRTKHPQSKPTTSQAPPHLCNVGSRTQVSDVASGLWRPSESVLITSTTSFELLGTEFEQLAPYAGCRICGKLYQSNLDRKSWHLFNLGFTEDALKVYEAATERRTRWREVHTRRYHSEREVAIFNTTGMAFTPEAAEKLSTYGIIPMGSIHLQGEEHYEEVVDAMAKAPRAPYEDAEGGRY